MRSMLDVAAGARPLSSRSELVRGAGALAIGALITLLAMLVKPPPLEFRWLETVLAGSGVLLASLGALRLVAALGAARQVGAVSTVELSARALLPGLALVFGSLAALTLLVNRAVVGVVPAPPISLG